MIKSTRAWRRRLGKPSGLPVQKPTSTASRPSTAMKFANTLPWFLRRWALACKPPKALGTKLSIALVLGDDMWFSDSATAGARSRFPILTDRLFGLRFSRFHTSALCGPSRVALVTGWRSPTQHPNERRAKTLVSRRASGCPYGSVAKS